MSLQVTSPYDGASVANLPYDSHADIERIAMIGDKKWEEWMAKFCGPFTQAEIKYFDHEEAANASPWLEEGLGA